MTDVFVDLERRGLLHQSTDADRLSQWLASESRSVYVGFDPTADSLHVGSLLPLMTLRRFQCAGHRPIALVGGATGMIGDPSGKSQERNLLSAEMLQANMAGIEAQLRGFLDFGDSAQAAVLVNNWDWMKEFGYLAFLRDVGKHFPVNAMLSKDSVKHRLGRDDIGISYTEFSYMLLQAYDFVHLHQRYDCGLQFGGSDQWGNITAGIDLARRLCGAHLHGLTCPLLTKSDGTKMGKTESGTIWLSPDRTSPYQFYQYWINVADDDVGKCLRFLTELGLEEIESLDASRQAAPQKRESQRRLAEELTRLVHGVEHLQVAQKATAFFFGAEIADVRDEQLNDVFGDVPSQQLPRAELGGDGLGLIEALAAAGLVKSKGEARRVIQEGGVYVNNRRLTDIASRLSVADLASETMVVLRRGKKRYALLKFVEN